MDLAKTRISAAEGGVTSHDAQLAACQQHLNKLYAEAQAADQAAELVCRVAVIMHSPAVYPCGPCYHCMVDLCCMTPYSSSIDGKQTAKLPPATWNPLYLARHCTCWDAGLRHSQK